MASSSTQSHDSFVQFGKKHVTAGLGRVVDAVLTKAEGSYVTLGDGRRMLDFTCGIGVTNLGECTYLFVGRSFNQSCIGHCHPKISKAAADQCMKAVHVQVRFFFVVVSSVPCRATAESAV